MKKLVLILLVVGVVVGAAPAWRYYQKSSTLSNATLRVEEMLRGMAQGTGIGEPAQLAIARWAENKIRIVDRDKLDHYSDLFDRFRKKKNLYRAFDSWEVLSAEIVDPEEPPLVEVSFDIEGKTYYVDVVEGEPIAWTGS